MSSVTGRPAIDRYTDKALTYMGLNPFHHIFVQYHKDQGYDIRCYYDIYRCSEITEGLDTSRPDDYIFIDENMDYADHYHQYCKIDGRHSITDNPRIFVQTIPQGSLQGSSLEEQGWQQLNNFLFYHRAWLDKFCSFMRKYTSVTIPNLMDEIKFWCEIRSQMRFKKYLRGVIEFLSMEYLITDLSKIVGEYLPNPCK